jgi:hypothetical protein
MDYGEEDHDAYLASQAVYGSQTHHTSLEKKGYKLDRDLSNYNTRVYSRNGKAYVVFRGTKLGIVSDLQADRDILIGTHRRNAQFIKAMRTVQKAKKKYGNDIIVTGHSLGGTKAIEAANSGNVKAIVFNPGTGLIPLNTGKHKVYVKDKDIISSRVKGQNIIKSSGGHSLSEFENDFRKRHGY